LLTIAAAQAIGEGDEPLAISDQRSFFGYWAYSRPHVERLSYILIHGVKQGLVSRCQQWPGPSSTQALLEGGRASLHRWRNWTRRWEMEVDEKVNVDRFSEECPSETESLELAPLPWWAALTARERSWRVAQLIADIDASAPNATTEDHFAHHRAGSSWHPHQDQPHSASQGARFDQAALDRGGSSISGS